MIATSLPQGVTAVADDGKGLARFYTLAGAHDEAACAEVSVVAEFPVFVLDGDEVAEAATLGVLPLAPIKGVDDASAHCSDAAATAHTYGSDIPGMETAAPVRRASVGALGDHPLFSSGGRKGVAVFSLYEKARRGTLSAVCVLNNDPVFAGSEAGRIASGDAARGCGLGLHGSNELPGVGWAVDGEVDDALRVEARAIELEICF